MIHILYLQSGRVSNALVLTVPFANGNALVAELLLPFVSKFGSNLYGKHKYSDNRSQ